MFRLQSNNLMIFGLHLCVGNQLVNIKDVDYTNKLQLVLRSLIKGHSLVLTRNTVDSLALGFGDFLENEDKIIIVLSLNEEYISNFNKACIVEDQTFPLQAFDTTFNVVDVACMYAKQHGIDFKHSREVFKTNDPRLFIFAHPNTVKSFGVGVDGFITIQIPSSDTPTTSVWDYYKQDEFVEKEITKHPDSVPCDVRYFEKRISI